MSKQTFTPEFKAEAVKQITERGYSVKDVSERLGVSVGKPRSTNLHTSGTDNAESGKTTD